MSLIAIIFLLLNTFDLNDGLHTVEVKNSDSKIFPTERFMNGLKKGFEQSCFNDFIICNQ